MLSSAMKARHLVVTPTSKCRFPGVLGGTLLTLSLLVACGGSGASGGGTTPEQQVVTPTFSPAGKTFSSGSTVNVAILDSTPNSTIYYTADGSNPSTGSSQYINPISISTTETIQAIAVASGYTTSAVATATYSTTPPVTTVNMSGKWEFLNGMNVNLLQNGTSITGNSVYQTHFSTGPSPLLIEPCFPNSVVGNINVLTVTLQSGNCGVAPAGGYSTTTTVNLTANIMSGGAWGDSFLVGKTTGQYSGTMTFYGSAGIVGTSEVTLTLQEGSAYSLTGTLNITNGSTLNGLTGQAVGGTIDLGQGEVVGVVQPLGGMNVSVLTNTGIFCESRCATVGIGTLK